MRTCSRYNLCQGNTGTMHRYEYKRQRKDPSSSILQALNFFYYTQMTSPRISLRYLPPNTVKIICNTLISLFIYTTEPPTTVFDFIDNYNLCTLQIAPECLVRIETRHSMKLQINAVNSIESGLIIILPFEIFIKD